MKKSLIILALAFIILPITIYGNFDTIKKNNPESNVEILKSKKVLQVNLRDNINSFTWIMIQKSFKEAVNDKYDCVLINMNTYGGEVLYADSIRSTILNAQFPVYVFINYNAASAGALISIACDSIYMRTGATIGASTVVDQTGTAAPDKYQSYMRGIIRATAESQGKKTIIKNGDTVEVWRRDPRIAEAMVDPDLYIEGIIDTGKVLTFTANEAFKYGYCEGISEDLRDVLEKHIGMTDYDLKVYKMTGADKLKGRLMSTAFRAILIMLIVAGIWFELQAPGIGLPSLAAAAAAILYFAPLYIDGLAQNWEIIIFVVGLLLMAVEIFILPGFGIAGILGSLFILSGLTFALIDNSTFDFTLKGLDSLAEPLLLVSISITVSVLISIWITNKIGHGKGFFRWIALTSAQNIEEGYLSVPQEFSDIVGKSGIAATVLRPSGKIRIEGKTYDAIAEVGFIEQGEKVRVNRYESGQLYVAKIE